jgi:hypothetical protein
MTMKLQTHPTFARQGQPAVPRIQPRGPANGCAFASIWPASFPKTLINLLNKSRRPLLLPTAMQPVLVKDVMPSHYVQTQHSAESFRGSSELKVQAKFLWKDIAA